METNTTHVKHNGRERPGHYFNLTSSNADKEQTYEKILRVKHNPGNPTK